jgi:TolB-like protein
LILPGAGPQRAPTHETRDEVKLLYFFEDYVLDSDRRELRSAAGAISVQPQVFDLLEYLIRNRERVVSKDDLIAGIWGGRIVSESALTTRINAARTAIGDSGEAQRLIRTLKRKGIRFVGAVREGASAGAPAQSGAGVSERPPTVSPTAHAGLDKPSIAVLPFENMSSDSDQEYFADGIVEEITTALSRIRSLLVIARNSSFAYKGRAVDIKQVGRELGVRYLVEGSVRKAADRVRITGQLIDATSGVHLWADRFEGPLDEIFDLQDLVTAKIVGAIAPKIERAEIDRARQKVTENLDAYDYFLRGKAALHAGTQLANDQALSLFYKAFELDGEFASAYGLAAYCYVWRQANGWMTDRIRETQETIRLARRAAQLGGDDSEALCFAGFALARAAGELAGGAALLEKALMLNPNLAAAWGFSGRVKVYLGQPEEAIEQLAHAMRLSPLDREIYGVQGSTAFAHYFCGRDHEASLWAQRAMRENPNFVPVVAIAAASSAMAGRRSEARDAMERLRQIAPTLRISEHFMFSRPEDMARLGAGLSKADLPP